jgi:hypothetical protein
MVLEYCNTGLAVAGLIIISTRLETPLIFVDVGPAPDARGQPQIRAEVLLRVGE